MMNKLIVLVLALAIAAPALADDLIPAPFRGEPGSTYSQWSYDDGEGVYDWDLPETFSFVSHPDKEDPYIEDPCSGAFSAQVWGIPDPCQAGGEVWVDTYMGRDGVINFGMASWDLNNFWSDPVQPAKDMWVQITYHNGTEVSSEIDFLGMGGFDPTADPCAPDTMGEYECPDAEWPEGMEVMWTWMQLVDPCDPCGPEEQWNWMESELVDWDPAWPDPLYTWSSSEFWFDGELVSETLLTDGWIHEVWKMTADFNPDFEWFEFGYVEGVMIDQIVIETLCYVPEPATMVLLGLGSLMMIRRKKR